MLSLARLAGLNASRQLTVAAAPCKNSFIIRSLSAAADLPYHIVMGMPALSPTMEEGTIAKWNVGEGESFVAGDSLAEIETDKATIDFEAQDDGFVAKILVDPKGGGSMVKVNEPIMVVVEDEADVASFRDFVPAKAPEPEATEPESTANKLSSPSSPDAPSPKIETPSVPAPPPLAAPVAPAPVLEPVAPATPVEAAPSVAHPSWGGEYIKQDSPLIRLIATKQKAYIEMYGTTGQTPIE